MIGWLDADKLADRCVSVPCCCRRWSSAHVESRDLTLALSPFLSVLSAVCRVNSKHLFHFPSSSVPRCSASPFLPVIYILTALSFRFYHLCQTAFFLKILPFCFVCLSSSFCSVRPPALLPPLLFALMINCCLQAENELPLCMVAGVCAVCDCFCLLCVTHILQRQRTSQKVPVLY